MLIHLFSLRPGDDYKRALQQRCVLFTVFLLVGLATVGTAVFLITTGLLPDGQDFPIGFYAGVGSSVALSCIAGLIYTLRLMRNEEKMRVEFIKETDEREREATLRATSATALILLAAVYVALMVTVVLNRTVFYTLLAVAVVFFAVFLSAHAYYGKKL